LIEQLAQKGPAPNHLRNGHPWRGHQRAHSHGVVHALVQIRRTKDRHPQRAGFSSDCRARRAQGFDDRGWVVAQAPEHAIENLKLAENPRATARKPSSASRRKKNFVNWDKKHFLSG